MSPENLIHKAGSVAAPFARIEFVTQKLER